MSVLSALVKVPSVVKKMEARFTKAPTYAGCGKGSHCPWSIG